MRAPALRPRAEARERWRLSAPAIAPAPSLRARPGRSLRTFRQSSPRCRSPAGACLLRIRVFRPDVVGDADLHAPAMRPGGEEKPARTARRRSPWAINATRSLREARGSIQAREPWRATASSRRTPRRWASAANAAMAQCASDARTTARRGTPECWARSDASHPVRGWEPPAEPRAARCFCGTRRFRAPPGNGSGGEQPRKRPALRDGAEPIEPGREHRSGLHWYRATNEADTGTETLTCPAAPLTGGRLARNPLWRTTL